MLSAAQREKRQSIIDACRSMNALGINQGTSGNISVRDGEGFLITPTSMPYDEMRPEDIIAMRFDRTVVGNGRPSTEWRFHLDIMRARPDVNAVVHAHPTYSTTLAILEREFHRCIIWSAPQAATQFAALATRLSAPRNSPTTRSKR